MFNFRSLVLILFLALFPLQNAFSQAFFFGQNRVQYDTFDWRIIKSEHFDIYYYDSRNYYMAEFTAFSLEAAYRQLQTDFDHELNDRIRVIIYDSHAAFSQTNVVPLPVNAQGIGGVTDLFKNRITMPFMANYSDFRRVLHHELVHAMVNDMYYGGTIQMLVAEGQRIFPLWFEEGLAEYTALGWDTQSDMFIRDAIINDYLAPIQFLSGFFAYRGGQSVWDYIVQEYGREKIPEILQRTRQTRNYQLAMRQSLGLTIPELSERWKDWLRKRYWPEIADRENLKEIAFNATEDRFRGSYNTSPALSPQGDRIAMITNRRGFFDVVVINAITGEKIKTLIRGEENVDFEELNILRPNLSWSPDGRQVVLSSTSRGRNDIAIVDYNTRDVKKIDFPSLSSIGSVSWSPDGEKIAFQGTDGSFVNIYVYNLESGEFLNLTNDVFSDKDPSWSNDSQSVLFASDRGPRVELNRYRENYSVLANPNLNQTDIYKVRVGENRATRLTNTSGWSEQRPIMTRDNEIMYISDQNGINNIYVMNLETRVTRPVTNLITGVMQMSLNADGSKVAVNSINGGFLDIFVIQDPRSRVRNRPLEPNLWAQRRATEAEESRVPALGFGREFFVTEFREDGFRMLSELTARELEREVEQPERRRPDQVIDFRNYQFDDDIEEEFEEPEEEEIFEPENTRTDDGRFIPRRYRLSFSPDFSYTAAQVGTYYGAFTFSQIAVSDVLGDHRLSFSTNLVFDLRNSNYALQYAYLRNRTNYIATLYHNAWAFQTFSGEIVRYRQFGGTVGAIHPLNRFERLEMTLGYVTLSRDLSAVFAGAGSVNDREYLIMPQVNYIRDVTIPGFLSPQKGRRYAVGVSGSPGFTEDFAGFVTASADFRQYVSLAPRYTLAFRASGAASFGRDSQQFLLGGMQNWINYRQAQRLSVEQLSSLFFSLPAMPMRGHAYNAGIGDRFALGNAEFRFPLIAAFIPGPIPLFPLYNVQGAAFVDVGATWEGASQNDLLVGTGFGLRTIVFGLPLRYDAGWPWESGEGFGDVIHYFSIGLDF